MLGCCILHIVSRLGMHWLPLHAPALHLLVSHHTRHSRCTIAGQAYLCASSTQDLTGDWLKCNRVDVSHCCLAFRSQHSILSAFGIQCTLQRTSYNGPASCAGQAAPVRTSTKLGWTGHLVSYIHAISVAIGWHQLCGDGVRQLRGWQAVAVPVHLGVHLRGASLHSAGLSL